MTDRPARVPGLILTLVATLLAAGGGPALAADGALQVRVQDFFGVIPDATVRIADDAGNTQRAQTDRTGVATFPAVAAGSYTVRASRTSGGRLSMGELEVAKASERRLNAVSGETHENVDFHLAAPRKR